MEQMKNKWKKYNKNIFCTFCGILFSLIILNILVNPFEIFNVPNIKHFNCIKPDKDRNQRITKIVAMKLEQKPISAIFLGSSRVNSSISETYYRKITGKYAKNLGMNALSHDETFKIGRNAILIHPEIETIYFALDFFRFLQKNKDNKRDVPFSNNAKLTISEFNPLILSFNTTIASVNTLIANILNKEEKNLDKKYIFKEKLKQYVFNYEDAVLVDEEISKIKKFKEEMESKGYRVVIYLNPTHALDLALIHKMGYLPLFFEWKLKLSKFFEYIDFDFVNDLTSEQINRGTKYFKESSHSTYLMGNVILDNLLTNTNKYGILTNSENVLFNNEKNKNALYIWETNNPFWMCEIEKRVLSEK